MIEKIEKIEKIIKKALLFKELGENQQKKLAKLCTLETYQKNALIFKEHEPSEHLWIIGTGLVEITKESHQVATLKAGQSLGEMALIQDKPRSACARVLKKVTLIRIPLTGLKQLIHQDAEFSIILKKISHELADRLRYTNEVTVNALKLRNEMGIFLLAIILGLSVYTTVLSTLMQLTKTQASGGILSVVLLILLWLAFFMLMLRLKYPLTLYGLTLIGWQKALREGVVFSVVIMLVLLLVKFLLIRSLPEYANVALLDPTAAITQKALLTHSIYFYLCLIGGLYILSSILQEFIIRGCLQSTMQRFLVGPYHQLWAILGSNTIFLVMHLHISHKLAFTVFLFGLYWGWLYTRHTNLIGVMISHILIGSWAFFGIGVQTFLF